MSKSPDIVARLRYGTSQRNHGSLIELCTEAADEIERLRTQCGGNCRYWEGRWRDEAAENERLQSCLYAQEDVKPLYDEIKRLRAEIKRLQTMISWKIDGTAPAPTKNQR